MSIFGGGLMKRLIIQANICAIVASFAVSAFCMEQTIDFNGTNNKVENLMSYINSSVPDTTILLPQKEFVSMPPKAEQTISVKSASGEWKIVNPERSEDGKGFYTFEPGIPLKLSWVCNYASRLSTKEDYWSARISFLYSLSSQIGTGHVNHFASEPFLFTDGTYFYPPGIFQVPIMQMNVPYDLYFDAPVFATQFRATVTTINCDNQMIATDVAIKVANLKPMPPGAVNGQDPNMRGYELVNTDIAHHPSAHNIAIQANGSSLLKNELLKAGSLWARLCAGAAPLQYQRMSLPLGGAFDEFYGWREPYFGHGWGEASDIAKLSVNTGDRNTLVGLLCQGFNVWSETDSTSDPSHYHVVRRSFPGGTDTDPASNSVFCCSKEADPVSFVPPEACVKLAEGFAESQPLTSNCPGLDWQTIKKLYNETSVPTEGQ